MIIYTDHPENSVAFLPPDHRWERLVPPNGPATHGGQGRDRLLRVFFADDAPIWRCETTGDQESGDPGRPLLIVDYAATSQFDAMRESLNQGLELPDGLVCLALEGEKHHGQRQRPWSALRGNLHLTAHYRLDCSVRKIEAAVSMVPAVATAFAIDAVTPPHCRPAIKWVNDILIDECKVSGGLTVTHVQGERVESVVFGIGVNVAVAPALSDATLKAGSLESARVELADLTGRLVAQLDRHVEKLRHYNVEAIYSDYRQYAGFLGRRVQIWPEGSDVATDCSAPLYEGVVDDLLPDLSLKLDTVDEPVRGGRMRLLPVEYVPIALQNNRI